MPILMFWRRDEGAAHPRRIESMPARGLRLDRDGMAAWFLHAVGDVIALECLQVVAGQRSDGDLMAIGRRQEGERIARGWREGGDGMVAG